MVRAVRVLAATVAVLVLSGCVAGPDAADGERPAVEIVPDVAVLDEATETMRGPLDAYGLDPRERRLLDRASDLLIEDCVHRSGRELTLIDVLQYPPSTQWSLNYFGPWTTERAARTGLAPPADERAEARRAEDEAMPADTYAAIMDCLDPEAMTEEAAVLEQRGPEESLVERGRSSSFSWASEDAVWQEALGRLQGCMGDRGYVYDASRNPYLPTITGDPDGEAGIRAALDHVECLGETGAAQTFVDVVAAYQVAFITENEGALVAEEKETRERVAHAERVISEH